MTEPGRAPRRIAVLASGGGTNLGALISYFHAAHPAVARIVLVASDRTSSGALGRAAAAGIAGHALSDPSDAGEITQLLAGHRADLVVLAGYLKLVPPDVTRRFAGAIVNVHPALLPAHGGHGMYGARVHRAVLAAGDRESGATVHFVDADYDRGAAIVRARVPVVAGDTPESLAARVLVAEHFVLPRAVHALAIGAVGLAASGSAVVEPAAHPLFAGPPPGVTIDLAN